MPKSDETQSDSEALTSSSSESNAAQTAAPAVDSLASNVNNTTKPLDEPATSTQDAVSANADTALLAAEDPTERNRKAAAVQDVSAVSPAVESPARAPSQDNAVSVAASIWGQAGNDPRVSPKPVADGPVLETVVITEAVNDLLYVPVNYGERHPSRWQRAGNDPRGVV